jgi:hypothetical protein
MGKSELLSEIFYVSYLAHFLFCSYEEKVIEPSVLKITS